MCPLRLILIFLSATLAGFFLIRNLRSQPLPTQPSDDVSDPTTNSSTPHITDPSLNATSKARAAIESGFWTFVDMASGRYLWKHTVFSSKRSN